MPALAHRNRPIRHSAQAMPLVTLEADDRRFVRVAVLALIGFDHPGGKVALEGGEGLVGLLTSLSHTYRDELDRTASETAPYYVRRADSFLRERFAERIAMRDVVEAARTSARSLFYGFRAYRGTTPMG